MVLVLPTSGAAPPAPEPALDMPSSFGSTKTHFSLESISWVLSVSFHCGEKVGIVRLKLSIR